MKPRAKPDESKFDPILDELHRARDAYARKFNFDVNAVCDALTRSTKHTPTTTKSSPASLKTSLAPNAGIEKAWSAEATRRLEEMENGTVTSIPVEAAIARARNSIR